MEFVTAEQYPHTWIFRNMVAEGVERDMVYLMVGRHIGALIEYVDRSNPDRRVAIKELTEYLQELEAQL